MKQCRVEEAKKEINSKVRKRGEEWAAGGGCVCPQAAGWDAPSVNETLSSVPVMTMCPSSCLSDVSHTFCRLSLTGFDQIACRFSLYTFSVYYAQKFVAVASPSSLHLERV